MKIHRSADAPVRNANFKQCGIGGRETLNADGGVRAPVNGLGRTRGGYILLELIIALSMFAIGVLGLAQTLNTSMEVANILNKDQRVRIGLRSFLEEVRRKPLNEMSANYVDVATGVTYTSSVERVALTTTRGEVLSDLYNLKVVATFVAGSEQQEESVDVYVYKPATR
jgi:Tfp pilus assembly protein PilV